jgi:hypothetical protein
LPIDVKVEGRIDMNFYDAVRGALKDQWCSYSYEDFVIAGLVAGSPLVLAQPVGSLAVAGTVTKGLERLRNASDGWCNKSQAGGSSGGGAGGTWDVPPPVIRGGKCPGVWYSGVNITETTTRQGGVVVTETRYIARRSLGVLNATIDLPRRFLNVASAAPQTSYSVPLGLGFDIFSVDSVQFVREDGQPDTCGDESVDIEPLPKIDDSIDIDFEDDDGNPVSFPDNPLETYPPCFSPTGVKLPFKVTTPLGDLCGKINFGLDSIGLGSNITPEVEFTQCRDNELALPPEAPDKDVFELSGMLGSGPTSPDSELIGSAIGDFDPEADKPILGVFVVAARENQDRLDQTKVIGSQTQEFPPLLYPDIGSVRFLLIVETDSGVSFSYSEPQRIQQVQSYIPCPSQFGAAAVEVLWRPGWDGSYQEARRKSCCDKCANEAPALPDELDRCA